MKSQTKPFKFRAVAQVWISYSFFLFNLSTWCKCLWDTNDYKINKWRSHKSKTLFTMCKKRCHLRTIAFRYWMHPEDIFSAIMCHIFPSIFWRGTNYSYFRTSSSLTYSWRRHLIEQAFYEMTFKSHNDCLYYVIITVL